MTDYMYIWLNGNVDFQQWTEGRREVGGASAPADPALFTSSHYFSLSPPFFDVVTPNPEPPGRPNRAARPRLAAHFAGRWRAIRHGEWGLRGGGL